MYQKCGFSCPYLGLTPELCPFIWEEGAEVMTEQGLLPWPPGSVNKVMELRLPGACCLHSGLHGSKGPTDCPLVLLLQVCSLVLAAVVVGRAYVCPGYLSI